MVGGIGNDIFVFESENDSFSSQSDWIKFFNIGSDLINVEALVSNGDIGGFADLDITNDGTNTLVSANNGSVFEFQMVGVLLLDADDFIV